LGKRDKEITVGIEHKSNKVSRIGIREVKTIWIKDIMKREDPMNKSC
jgi:hypothetical protein